MARFPMIDNPCPLGIDEQRRLDGFCGRCGMQVHAIDAMSDQQRRAFMDAAAGPLCVSYHIQRPRQDHRAAGFGLAIAATLMTGGAFAGQQTLQQSVVAETPLSDTPSSPVAADPLIEEATMLDRIVWVGGINDPGKADWVDDESLPELPMQRADDAAGQASSSD